jgi:hypothetical protein
MRTKEMVYRTMERSSSLSCSETVVLGFVRGEVKEMAGSGEVET